MATGDEHRPLAEPRKVTLDDEILKVRGFGQCTCRRFAKLSNVPMSPVQLEEVLAQRVMHARLEHAVERRAGRNDTKVGVENEEGFPHGVDDGESVVSGVPQLGLATVERGIDISELRILARQLLVELWRVGR